MRTAFSTRTSRRIILSFNKNPDLAIIISWNYENKDYMKYVSRRLIGISKFTEQTRCACSLLRIRGGGSQCVKFLLESLASLYLLSFCKNDFRQSARVSFMSL